MGPLLIIVRRPKHIEHLLETGTILREASVIAAEASVELHRYFKRAGFFTQVVYTAGFSAFEHLVPSPDS